MQSRTPKKTSSTAMTIVQPTKANTNAPQRTRRRRGGGTRKGGGGATTLDDDENCGMTVATVDENEPVEFKRPKKPAEIVMENFGLSVAKKKLEGLKNEFKELQNFVPSDTVATAFAVNKDKNRYNNVPCYDRSRVVLTYNVPPNTDYIHANWVVSTTVKLTNKYICTQGPTDATVNDFWRLVFQEKVKFIVMLCDVVENGKPKCAQYYPLRLDEKKVYDTVSVTKKKNLTPFTEKIFESTLLEVEVEGLETFQLTLLRWINWPDFSIPMSGMGMLRILKLIRDCPNTTAIIHCSAGVGRTGTLMACEICLRVLLEGKELNISEVVKELRCQRAGSIQTESQYIYLHRALTEYIHVKKILKKELTDFFVAFTEYRKSLLKSDETKLDNNLAGITAIPKTQSPLPTQTVRPK